LSVEISQIVSSAITQSPGRLCHETTVPSATDTPIWGMTTSSSVAPSPAVKTAEASKVPQPPALPPELLKQRQLDATFANALAPVEGRVAGWDFQGAVTESETVRFDSPEFTARLASRREQVRRMADLKNRMIATINEADPHMTKTDLALRGINGELSKAGAEGIAARLPSGKEESIVWSEVGPKALQKLLQLVVRRDDPDFRLAVNRGLVDLYRSGEIDPIFYRWLANLGQPGPLLNAMFYLSTLPQ